MLGWEVVAAIIGGGTRVVDLEVPADSLMLEPLPGVAGRGAGALGELGRRCRAVLRERAIPASRSPR